MATAETMELIRVNNYTLILDEVLNVIEQIPLKKSDLKLLEEADAIRIIKKENGLKYIEWNDNKKDYDTKYNNIKKMALTNNLMYCDNSALIWNLPCELFSLFQNVFILTYMFKGQIQKAYYDLHGVGYRYLSVIKEDDGYVLVPYKDRVPYDKEFLNRKINIYDGHLNKIGDTSYSLSKGWFEKHANKELVKKLRNNARNYLMNICKETSENVMWTTIKGDKDRIIKHVTPKGYKGSFLSMTSRATNDYKEKSCMAYLVNRFINPITKQFFEQYGVKIDQETWAVAELIQWIWRSRIRDGLPIQIYIPSKRMRDLFNTYLHSEKYEEAPANAIIDESPSDWNL